MLKRGSDTGSCVYFAASLCKQNMRQRSRFSLLVKLRFNCLANLPSFALHWAPTPALSVSCLYPGPPTIGFGYRQAPQKALALGR